MRPSDVRPSLIVRSANGRRIAHLIGLALLVAAVAAPMAWAVGYATLYSCGAIGLLSDGVTARHWQEALSTGGLWSSVVYSVAVALVATGLAYVASLGLVLTAPQSRHSALRMGFLIVPLATPTAVVALLAYQLLNPGGLLSRILVACGMSDSPTDFPVLVNDTWSVGLVLAQAAASFPLLALFLFKSWTNAGIDRYCRLAESLGASVWAARLTVAFPMLVLRSRSLVLFLFLVNLGAYELPLVLGRQTPQMFSVLTQRRFGQFDLAQRPQAFALALVYLAVVSVGTVLLTVWRRPRS